MTTDQRAREIEQQARELLEAEFANERMNVVSNEVPYGFFCRRDQASLRAITKALSLSSGGIDTGWQPIETAPDCEDGILIVDADKPEAAVGVACFIAGAWRGWCHSMSVECQWPTPTHWMPLPSPPAGDSQHDTR